MATSTYTSVSSIPQNIPYTKYEATEPSSGRMAVAIAGYPYSARAAILDIVDNSVAAQATGIDIVLPSGAEGRIAIADNGIGIAPEILGEVLRAGSRVQERYESQSLSRYGIGLKGAGFSLGEKIAVLTEASKQPLRRRAIELQVIQANDAWIQETREPDETERLEFETAISMLPLRNGKRTGTLVVIERLNLRSRDIGRLKTEIARALGETYQKFLSRGLLKIRLNGIEIEPNDPLHRENPATLMLYKREPISLSNGAVIYFSAVSLPHPNQLPIEIRRRYRYTQTNQGFYLFRNGRLLRSGESLGLFSPDFHYNAFRAELEYSTDADEHINVDVAKSVVTVTPEVQQKLQEFVQVSRKTAETLWREKDVLTEEDVKGLFDETNRLIASRSNLLAETAESRKKKARASSASSARPPHVNGNSAAGARQTGTSSSGPATLPGKAAPALPASKTSPRDIPYLQQVDTLPADVLYRPIWNGDLSAVVVQINRSHPFYKAVFSSSPGEGRDSLPRTAATATQQLIYTLGSTEWSLAVDEDQERLFEQYRRYASMNLRALLE
jgi:histidine kinase/DNA gyrase B/HSP90-like ATPase